MADAFPPGGSIDPQSFPFLVADLHGRGATGSLKTEGPEFPKALYLRSGRILFGSSNDPKDQLGAILIEQGKISQEQFDQVNVKVGPGNPLAKVLAESGFVNQRELSDAARVKVERILSDILGYTGGSYEFEDGVLPKGAVDLKLSTEKLLISAVRKIADRGFVLRHLGGLEGVFVIDAERLAALAEIQSELASLPQQFDGQSSLREAISRTRLDEFDGAKLACALLFLGILRHADGEVLDLAHEAAAGLGEGLPRHDDEGLVFAPSDVPFPSSAPSPIVPDEEEGQAPTVILPAADKDPFTFDVQDDAPPAPPVESAPFPAPSAAVAWSPPPSAPIEVETVPGGSRPSVRTPAPSPPPAELWSPPPPGAFGEDSSPPERTAVRPPSREDLAALDALLNPTRAAARPPTSFGTLTPARAPSFPTMARRIPKQHPSRVPAIAIVLVLLVVVGGGGFVAYTQWYGPGGTPPWGPKAKPTPAVTSMPTQEAAAPQPTPTERLTPTPVLEPSPSPEAAAATPSAAPTAPPPTTAVVSVAPTPLPIHSPTPLPSMRPTAAPTVPPRSTMTALEPPSLGNARTLLRQGAYGEAGRSFAALLRGRRGFSIQVLVACAPETIQKATAAVGVEEMLLVPVDYKGRPCHRVAWGLYDSDAAASAALRSLPSYFRQAGVHPKVVHAAELPP